MKKLFFILFTLGAVFTFTACGSDDDEPQKVEKNFNGVCKQTVTLQAYKDQPTTTVPVSETLDDMLKNSSGFGSPVTAGTLNLTGNTSIKITGLQEGVTLKSFKLTLNGSERDFGDLTDVKANLYTDDNLEYFKSAFAKMITDQKLTISATFTPSADIVPADNVKLEISYDGRFTYWVTQ
jgi:hypothetical protein